MPRENAVTLRQLRALRAVAEHGAIAAAAREIHLSAPAVHAQIKNLSLALRAEVLRRAPSGAMVPTDAGAAVLAAARRMEAELSACLDEVRALNAGRAGVVRLGVVSTAKYFAPGLVARLKRAFPDIEVRLSVGNRDRVVAALDSRAIQLAIMGRPPRAPAVEAEILGPHPNGIIAAPDHPLAGRARVTADELLAQTFIAREEGSGTRILMTRYLDRIGEGRTYDVMAMDSNETIKQAVIAGLGIALISLHTTVEEVRAGRLALLRAEGLPIRRRWYLLHRSDEALSPAAERARAFVSGLKGAFLPDADASPPPPPGG